MKLGREHRIPLSRQAIAVLDAARCELSGGTGLIFPSKRGKPLTDSTISKMLRENNVRCVPHGMRSSFRDWAAESSDEPREIAEHALGHVEGSASERAYRRTDYFERRRALMQEWADYILP
jgi:integrase